MKEEGEQVVTYESGSLMQLHTRGEGEGRVSLEELRPTDWQTDRAQTWNTLWTCQGAWILHLYQVMKSTLTSIFWNSEKFTAYSTRLKKKIITSQDRLQYAAEANNSCFSGLEHGKYISCSHHLSSQKSESPASHNYHSGPRVTEAFSFYDSVITRLHCLLQKKWEDREAYGSN